jgi:hypothetical protein
MKRSHGKDTYIKLWPENPNKISQLGHNYYDDDDDDDDDDIKMDVKRHELQRSELV